ENQFPANFGRPFLGLLTNSPHSYIILALHHSMNSQICIYLKKKELKKPVAFIVLNNSNFETKSI
ncbi:hypothetical protein BpHYR1_048812, partial [Brachionus plicatilis]